MTNVEENPTEAGKAVIARAAAVLRTLERQPAGLNLSQIARSSRLPRTTVTRLVTALAAEGLLTMDGDGRVRLGPALARLAAAARDDLSARLRPHMERLALATGETVHLWALAEPHIVLIDQIVSEREVRVALALGARLPLACSAGGKAILATLDRETVLRLTRDRLEAHTPNSQRDLDALAGELAGVRDRGLAFDREEHALGVSAGGFAVPGGGTRFALSVVAPTQRFDTDLDRIAAALGACRTALLAEAGPH